MKCYLVMRERDREKEETENKGQRAACTKTNGKKDTKKLRWPKIENQDKSNQGVNTKEPAERCVMERETETEHRQAHSYHRSGVSFVSNESV